MCVFIHSCRINFVCVGGSYDKASCCFCCCYHYCSMQAKNFKWNVGVCTLVRCALALYTRCFFCSFFFIFFDLVVVAYFSCCMCSGFFLRDRANGYTRNFYCGKYSVDGWSYLIQKMSSHVFCGKPKRFRSFVFCTLSPPFCTYMHNINRIEWKNFERILVGSDSGVTKNYHFCLLLLLLSFFWLATWLCFFFSLLLLLLLLNSLAAIAVIAVVAHSAICFVFIHWLHSIFSIFIACKLMLHRPYTIQ